MRFPVGACSVVLFAGTYLICYDTLFVVCFFSVVLAVMQFGFAALEVGSIRPKNTKAVLLKNISDAAIG